MDRFDAPGFLEDFNAAQKEQWSEWISSQIDEAAAGRPDLFDLDAPRPHFFNPMTQPPEADAVEKDIDWKAFPRLIELDAASDEERWEIADGSRDVQDEYCEWSVTRDQPGGKITRVTFTSEAPEYWQFLAAVNFPLVVKLYQTHVNPSVKAADLVDSQGQYNPRNRWNSTTTRGAMHLIQAANSLGAEIELAAGSSNVRSRGGALLTEERELIKCGRYGEIERHSDPHIGSVVNELSRMNAAVTLANPVGLCIGGLSTAGWKTPDDSNPLDFWTITRGRPEKALRAVYEVPENLGYKVGDITINGQDIRFGSQIADFIRIKLTGLATNFGNVTPPVITGCKKPHQAAPGIAASFKTVAETIGSFPRATR